MAGGAKVAAVYGAGLVQGLVLVIFPAASAVFTRASAYGLSSTEYGAMFVPQAITAIGFALLGAGLTRRLGTRRIFQVGLAADLASMALLLASLAVMKEHARAYIVLLAATGCLGIGFGLTVPALNTLAAAYFPGAVDKAVLILNALLGVGTALAPVLVAVFVGLGFWWGLPALAAALTAALLGFSLVVPSVGAAQTTADGAPPASATVPSRFWAYAAIALMYGICETVNGNWASLYMAQHVKASAAQASLALAVFWGMVTAGRLLFAATERWLPERTVFRGLPLLLAAVFVASAILPQGNGVLGIVVFALAGLGCSALLPATISFAEADLPAPSASVAGLLIGAYEIGYGIAAFGVAPLQAAAGVPLSVIFGVTAVIPIALAALGAIVTRGAGGHAAAAPG